MKLQTILITLIASMVLTACGGSEKPTKKGVLDKTKETAASVKDKAGDMKDAIQEAAGDAKDKVTSMTTGAVTAVKETAADAKDAVTDDKALATEDDDEEPECD